MKDEIKEIINKFDKVLENYELDKKFGQMSVDSICHLFPNEMTIIKNCITNLQEENEKLKQFYHKKEVYSLEYDKETLTTMICEKQERIDKAIEYIKSYKNDYAPYELSDYNIRELLNILQGSNDNE